MIQETVVGLQILVGVVFRLPNRPDIEIEFVVDTGFEGALSKHRGGCCAIHSERWLPEQGYGWTAL